MSTSSRKTCAWDNDNACDRPRIAAALIVGGELIPLRYCAEHLRVVARGVDRVNAQMQVTNAIVS